MREAVVANLQAPLEQKIEAGLALGIARKQARGGSPIRSVHFVEAKQRDGIEVIVTTDEYRTTAFPTVFLDLIDGIEDANSAPTDIVYPNFTGDIEKGVEGENVLFEWRP